MNILENSDLLESLLVNVGQMAVAFSGKLISAVITLIIGWFVLKYLNKIVKKAFEKSDFDETLEKFIENLISIGLKIVLFIIVASMLGIEMTSFVALLGAAGLAIGLALQGSLSNFAGGVLILMFKPFSVGHFIEAGSQKGRVKSINIFYTTLETIRSQVITIPNGELSNNPVVNYTANDQRRTDLTVGISYDDDVKKARTVILNIIKNDERFLSNPEPQVVLGELADSSVNLYVRASIPTSDYGSAYFDLIESIKTEFDASGISFPFPQRTVHIIND